MMIFFANVGIQPKSPGPPDFAGTPGRNGTTVITTVDVTNISWNPNEMGVFDPIYDNKSINIGSAIEHVGKNIYFRDVHFFIERIQKITLIKPVDFVRVNFWMNFRGTAFEWWTTELSNTEKKTKFGDSVDEWFTLLIFKLKKPFTAAIDIMFHEKYTMKNEVNCREPREFIQKVIRSAKNSGFTQTKIQRHHLQCSRI